MRAELAQMGLVFVSASAQWSCLHDVLVKFRSKNRSMKRSVHPRYQGFGGGGGFGTPVVSYAPLPMLGC
jgi:hypothetical protein